MNKEPKIIVVRPSDTTLNNSDLVESIISGILESGEVDVVGINDSIFLVCSAVNMATDIANIFIEEICVEPLDDPELGKVASLSVYLTQSKTVDFEKLASEYDREITNEQTVSVSRGINMDKLLTISLLKLSRNDKIKFMAAGGAINDAVSLALKLTTGRISKDLVGVSLIHVYSIIARDDPTRNTTAISIYLAKGMTTKFSKRHDEFTRKLYPHTI
jgi:DNA-binding protein